MYEDCPPVSTPTLMIAGNRILRVSLKLYVLSDHSVGDNLHTLFPLIGRVAPVTCLIFIVKDDDFTESIFNLIALFAGLVSPLFELSERDMLDLLASLHPRAGLEHFIIIGVCVTNVGDDCKLYSAS